MKAYEQPFNKISLEAGASFAAARYTFVTVNTSGKAIGAVAGGKIVGVVQDTTPAGGAAPITAAGITFIKLGGTVASGALVEVGANGTAITNDAGTAVGICLVGGASGEYGSILLK